jgi:addiction module RelE/StbE family toxin
MSAGYKVLWTEVAERDLGEALAFIARENPGNARKLLELIRQKAADLETFPERGRIVPELYEQGISVYRELVIAQWRLLYRIADGEVQVLSFIDSRRNVEDILLQRFIRR